MSGRAVGVVLAWAMLAGTMQAGAAWGATGRTGTAVLPPDGRVVPVQGSPQGGAQPGGIKGSDVMSGRGEGPSGWVQAPIPRGLDASRTPPGTGGQGTGAGQTPPGQNPATPVGNPLPGPGGMGTMKQP